MLFCNDASAKHLRDVGRPLACADSVCPQKMETTAKIAPAQN